MRWLTDVGFRLRAVFARRAMERELDEELSFHLEMEAAKLEREGVPPREAIRRARLAFGGQERFRERARESWGVGAFDDLARDLRFSGRQLAKQRGFTGLAVGTLALGIGATTALFSVVHGLLLRPLPIPDEARVVSFWSDYNWRGEEFDHVKGVPSGFASLAAYSIDAYTLRTDAGSSLILATVASTELFDVMGVRPLVGRGFLPGEDRPGAEPVIVLGHSVGGLIASTYTYEHQEDVAGLICESWAYDVGLPHLVQLAFEGVGAIAPHLPFFSLKNEIFSRDPKVVDEMNSDPLIAHEKQPAETLSEVLKAAARIGENMPKIKVPVFIIHGTDDKATRWQGSQYFYDNVGSTDKTLKLYEGGYHDLLNDIEKETVMADILAWVNERVPAQTAASA